MSKDFARYSHTWQYEFDHRTGPRLTPIPGYEWSAGHAAELAHMWPSFDNGTPIAPTFNAAERELATDMKLYWGALAIRHDRERAGTRALAVIHVDRRRPVVAPEHGDHRGRLLRRASMQLLELDQPVITR